MKRSGGKSLAWLPHEFGRPPSWRQTCLRATHRQAALLASPRPVLVSVPRSVAVSVPRSVLVSVPRSVVVS